MHGALLISVVSIIVQRGQCVSQYVCRYDRGGALVVAFGEVFELAL